MGRVPAQTDVRCASGNFLYGKAGTQDLASIIVLCAGKQI